MAQDKQRDKIELYHWLALPMLRKYLQSAYASWCVLTGGADHAEAYMRISELKAKGTEKNKLQQLEDCYCSDPRYPLAEEKFGVEFQVEGRNLISITEKLTSGWIKEVFPYTSG